LIYFKKKETQPDTTNAGNARFVVHNLSLSLCCAKKLVDRRIVSSSIPLRITGSHYVLLVVPTL